MAQDKRYLGIGNGIYRVVDSTGTVLGYSTERNGPIVGDTEDSALQAKAKGEKDAQTAEVDAMWNEVIEKQKVLLSNTPEGATARAQLDQEIRSMFRPGFDAMTNILSEQKQLTLQKINSAYKFAIEEINNQKNVSEQQRVQAIQDVTTSFIQTNKELNVTERVAYQNATKQLKDSAIQAGNQSAQMFLQTTAAGVGGNIGKVGQAQLIEQLNSINEDTIRGYQQQVEQVALKREQLATSLESQVGTDRADEIINGLQENDPTLSGPQAQAFIAARAPANATSLVDAQGRPIGSQGNAGLSTTFGSSKEQLSGTLAGGQQGKIESAFAQQQAALNLAARQQEAQRGFDIRQTEIAAKQQEELRRQELEAAVAAKKQSELGNAQQILQSQVDVSNLEKNLFLNRQQFQIS